MVHIFNYTGLYDIGYVEKNINLPNKKVRDGEHLVRSSNSVSVKYEGGVEGGY